MPNVVGALDSLSTLWIRLQQRLARLLGRRFPIALALLLSAAAVVDTYYRPFMAGLEARSYDLIMRHRFVVPPPDPDIVVVDIDEASLAALSEEYGRWPWPRAVLAEVLEALEAQGARAVFFDILFADPDTRNPESEAIFDEAVAASKRSYFAMLRLDRGRDAKSDLRASQVPAAALAPEGEGDPTVAMILPRFPAIIASGRLGTVDAEPDRDGVVRRFALYQDAGGWRIPSLPLTLARDLGMTVPQERHIHLNWRGPPFTYSFVPFHEVHADALRKDKRRDPKEFAGKIVLIGSTAPALFDLRATPMAPIHPGVEILATTIDNLKNGDYYRALGRTVPFAVSLALIWGLALGLRSLTRGSLARPVMIGVQLLLVLIAYVFMNVTHYYADLVAPITLGLIFFVALSVRADLREQAARVDHAVSFALERDRDYRLLLLVVESSRNRLRARTRAWIVDRVCASKARARWADPPFRGRGVLGGDFNGLATVYWIVPQSNEAGALVARGELQAFSDRISQLERSDVKMITRESTFTFRDERPGVVGRMIIAALQDLRRVDA
jgi:CHASE2 domain-containing sensor protein